jgi:hypothetical protein
VSSTRRDIAGSLDQFNVGARPGRQNGFAKIFEKG